MSCIKLKGSNEYNIIMLNKLIIYQMFKVLLFKANPEKRD